VSSSIRRNRRSQNLRCRFPWERQYQHGRCEQRDARKNETAAKTSGSPAHCSRRVRPNKAAKVSDESALSQEATKGWRAAETGVQTIRLIFDQPQSLKRISLVFVEMEVSRTQEFILRWSPDRGNSFREIVRQQWNFSRPDATRETEDYAVEPSNVTLLELIIGPDKENRKARASLLSLHLA
jgi:hypothetical protein